jgi:CheY-like chemotaxis protein
MEKAPASAGRVFADCPSIQPTGATSPSNCVTTIPPSDTAQTSLLNKANMLPSPSPQDLKYRNQVEAAPHIRVMVVEDFDVFRRFVCSKLEQRPELRVICEVTDGLEAVQKAEELRPDVILLDVSLPTLNGFQAARRIRNLAPESKIIFSSQDISPNIIQEALMLGAWGYIYKSRAGTHLLQAFDAVLSGKKFVSGA